MQIPDWWPHHLQGGVPLVGFQARVKVSTGPEIEFNINCANDVMMLTNINKFFLKFKVETISMLSKCPSGKLVAVESFILI